MMSSLFWSPQLVDAATKALGPIFGFIIALLMIPLIIYLAKKCDRIQKEKDESAASHKKEIREVLDMHYESLKIVEKMLEMEQSDEPEKRNFRGEVREHITEQKTFRRDVHRNLNLIIDRR